MRLDPSSAFETISAPKDYKDKSTYPDGIAGIYPVTDGTIDFVDSRGQAHTGVPVQTGNTPPIRGSINITATTATLLVGIN